LATIALRCIKDWTSTVLVLTRVACNISGKENAMGICEEAWEKGPMALIKQFE